MGLSARSPVESPSSLDNIHGVPGSAGFRVAAPNKKESRNFNIDITTIGLISRNNSSGAYLAPYHAKRRRSHPVTPSSHHPPYL